MHHWTIQSRHKRKTKKMPDAADIPGYNGQDIIF